MSVQIVLAPLFLQVLLVFCLGIWTFKERRGALVRREVHFRDIALREPKWPAKTTQVGNSFSNQFEIPVLFYVVVILAVITRQADFLFVILSWAFVVSRYVHAFIHTTSNRVSQRGMVYGLGVLFVLALWIELALRLYLS